ncbi:ORF6N domain-containing protein [Paludibacter sp.]
MKPQIIQNKIYEIRGQKVMLDFDLAELYGTETKQLKRAVRRNMKRFEGEDFMFELTWEEISRYQIGTLNDEQGKNIKYLPFAFTELGVAMLSSVLNNDIAIEINKNIMRAFVVIRVTLQNHPINQTHVIQQEIKELKEYIEEIFSDQNDINEDTRLQLDLINKALAELQTRKTDRPQIGFDAERYKK